MSQIIDVAPVGMPLNSVHGEYAAYTPAQVADLARKKLQEYIDKGRASAAATVRQILDSTPRDYVMPTRAMKVAPAGTGFELVGNKTRFSIHPHALGQIVDRVEMGRKLTHSLEGSDWGRKLIAHNLGEMLAHQPEDERALVRTVDGEVRGVLSDSYRRIDTRPAIEALVGVAQEAGAVITHGFAGDVKASIKVVMARPIEVYPNEWACFGLDYSNSDYGAGARELSGWILRLLCLNGAQVVTSYRKVHLGKRLEDGIQYSDETYTADAKATALQTRDLARALLGPKAIDAFVQQIRAAASTPVDAEKELKALRPRINKSEDETLRKAYNSADIVELPAGQTQWRFSNALSWLAKNTEDGMRRLEIERMAGEYLPAAKAA